MDPRVIGADDARTVRLYEVLFRYGIGSGETDGATSVTEMTNMPWGDRVGRVRDPLGNLWWIMTRVEDLEPEELEKRYGQQEYLDAMEYVQGAEFFPPG